MIARVQPLTRTRAVRGPFDYRLAPGQQVQVGSLLRVPFGARSSLGVVVELAERSELDPERLMEPEAVIGVGVGADLVALAGWMAREYCSTPSRALQLMLAPGASTGTGAKLALVAELTSAGRAALGDPGAGLNERQRALLRALIERGPTLASELDTPGRRRLQRRGLVTMDRRARPRRPARVQIGSASATAPPLTGEQTQALAPLVAGLGRRDPRHPGYLLQGVTGSGKTEVYLGAVAAALAAGRTAIVLVPEIALTPQALWRFQARFGDVVAVLHSALSTGERHDEWMRLRSG